MNMKENKKHFSKLGTRYLIGTIIIMAVQIIFQTGLLALFPDMKTNYDFVLASMMLPMYILGYPLMYLVVNTMKGEKIETHEMSPSKLVVAVCICYAIVMLGNMVGLIITMLVGMLKGGSVANPFVEIATTGNVWITAAYTVLLAPVFEEFLFRKMLVDRCIKYGQGTAVIVSGVMFGLFHGNLNQIVYAIPLGMMLAFIYAKTGRVKYTIIIHMAVNFFGSVPAAIINTYVNPESIVGVLAVIAYYLVIMGILVTGIAFLIISKNSLVCAAGVIELPKQERIKTIFLNPGMLIFCGVYIISAVLQLFM